MANQHNSTKRTIISFGIALAMSLVSMYVQDYTEASKMDNKDLEANVGPIESASSIETLH